MIKIKLPFPPSELSPNKPLHHILKYKAKKQYKSICNLQSLMQVQNNVDKLACLLDLKQAVNAKKRLKLHMNFTLPSRHRFDEDNLVARMKSGIDALADILKVDDINFKISSEVEREFIDPQKMGYVDCYFSILEPHP